MIMVRDTGSITRIPEKKSSKLNVSRESLYRSFSRAGNPSFTTVIKMLDLLGYRIEIKQKTA
jgi:probable addiction module antidote protein